MKRMQSAHAVHERTFDAKESIHPSSPNAKKALEARSFKNPGRADALLWDSRNACIRRCEEHAIQIRLFGGATEAAPMAFGK